MSLYLDVRTFFCSHNSSFFEINYVYPKHGRMNVEYFREYCLNKSNVSESMPFGDDVLVFKVFDKMFALLRMKENQESSVNLKCEPEKAIELREMYAAVKPGYHMHKKHWNTLFFNQDLKDEILLGLIDHSYNLIVDKLTKKQKQELH